METFDEDLDTLAGVETPRIAGPYRDTMTTQGFAYPDARGATLENTWQAVISRSNESSPEFSWNLQEWRVGSWWRAGKWVTQARGWAYDYKEAVDKSRTKKAVLLTMRAEARSVVPL